MKCKYLHYHNIYSLHVMFNQGVRPHNVSVQVKPFNSILVKGLLKQSQLLTAKDSNKQKLALIFCLLKQIGDWFHCYAFALSDLCYWQCRQEAVWGDRTGELDALFLLLDMMLVILPKNLMKLGRVCVRVCAGVVRADWWGESKGCSSAHLCQ